MAASVRLTVRGELAALSVGPFGHSVVELALGDGLVAHIDPVRDLTSVPSTTRCILVASWRPVPSLWLTVDEFATTNRLSWLPVTMDHPRMTVGPVFRPLQPPCFSCFRSRQFQHDPDADTTQLLEAAYDRDDTLGPRAHLPHHARSAAALASSLIRPTGTDGSVNAGECYTASLARFEIEVSRVLPCYGCPSCNADPARTRHDDEASAVLEALAAAWSAGSEDGEHDYA
ncbi:TOMM precursor leader peptide-binding protein [Kitasatospora sp. LaBMicrA B282]|uniref:TOMM precursor leader peptide-binding protein n=1 Tax=Kitasatospora sp. LaBMicrA B282 TaxID=3420949 RepID=UPI003D12D88E